MTLPGRGVSGTLRAMILDLVSIILVIALCSLFMCVALCLTVDWKNPEPGTRWWIAGFAGFAIGFCINGFQSLLPPIAGLAVGSTVLVAGGGMILIGTQRFLDAPAHHELGVVFATLTTAVSLAILVYVWPTVNGRIAVSNIMMAALTGAYAIMLVSHAPREMYAPSRLIAAAAIIMAVLLSARAFVVLASPPLASSLEYSLINAMVYLGAALAQLALGLGCYFMLMIRRHSALQTLSATDPLTGSLNRRGLEVATMRAEHDFRRTWTPFSIVAIDLDHFKAVNDTHGHAIGDVVLQRLVTECRSKLRGDSVVARLGGEEFCILLPGCKREDAYTVAERIRASFADARVDAAGKVLQCSVSMGVAQCHAGAADFAAVHKEADDALYRAKNAGRNRVEQSNVPLMVTAPPAKPT